MPVRRWWDRAQALAGAPSLRGLGVRAEDWLQAACDVAAAGGRLLSLWASGETRDMDSAAVYAAYLSDLGVLILQLAIEPRSAGEHGDYPGLEGIFPAASRMQRAAFDVSSVRSSDPDRRPWLRHGEHYDLDRKSVV